MSLEKRVFCFFLCLTAVSLQWWGRGAWGRLPEAGGRGQLGAARQWWVAQETWVWLPQAPSSPVLGTFTGTVTSLVPLPTSLPLRPSGT